MRTKITPNGIILLIEHEGKTYHGYLQNDFDRFKTFGNYDLDVSTLILFDEEFNKVPYPSEDLYDKMEELIENIVIYERDDEDEMNELIEEDEK